jgi:HAD superfamily hydrolase (TIGR01509 family)
MLIPPHAPDRRRRPALGARGFVFDLDGTLVANLPVHMEAFALLAQRHGLTGLTPELRARLDGRRNSDVFPILFGRPLSEQELRRYSDEKEALYRELSRGRLAPLPGLERLLALLERRRLPVAVATSSPADNVPHTLGELGLIRLLPFVVRADEVPRGKPHPDVFLEAASRIGIPPRECLAFEDAPSGIRAARAAGMSCVALTTSHAEADFRGHDAAPDAAVPDYDAFLSGPGAWLTDADSTASSPPTRLA